MRCNSACLIVLYAICWLHLSNKNIEPVKKNNMFFTFALSDYYSDVLYDFFQDRSCLNHSCLVKCHSICFPGTSGSCCCTSFLVKHLTSMFLCDLDTVWQLWFPTFLAWRSVSLQGLDIGFVTGMSHLAVRIRV